MVVTSHLRASAAVAKWLKAPVLETKTWVQLYSWPSLSSNQDYFESSMHIIFFDCDEIALNIFCLTLGTIRGYEVSFFVRMPQKALS